MGARDHDAFEELYRRHAAAVASIAYRVTRDPQAADDVAQQTFLTLWNRASAYDAARGRLRAWLVTVARNAALDRVRRDAPQRNVAIGEAGAVSGAESDPERAFVRADDVRAVRAAVDRLSAEQRAVIELAWFGELTQSEIAATLGEPLGTVKSRVRLAMQRLRRELARDFSVRQ